MKKDTIIILTDYYIYHYIIITYIIIYVIITYIIICNNMY